MRNLTSVQSTTDVLFDAEFQLTASDQSTTFIFDTSQVEAMPEIEWEVDFAGGFGKTSNYNITIISSLDFVKENLSKFVNGGTNLKITVNSDTFFPHVGKVRSVRRDSTLPGRVTFEVYDKFLNDKKRFPVTALVDSYDSLHPEVIKDEWGQPQYYGANVRPYYHVAVNCEVSELLTPLNITSENLVNSVYFNNELTKSDDPLSINVFDIVGGISQNSQTITTSKYPFLISDSERLGKIVKFGSLSDSNVSQPDSFRVQTAKYIKKGFNQVQAIPDVSSRGGSPSENSSIRFSTEQSANNSLKIEQVQYLFSQSSTDIGSSFDSGDLRLNFTRNNSSSLLSLDNYLSSNSSGFFTVNTFEVNSIDQVVTQDSSFSGIFTDGFEGERLDLTFNSVNRSLSTRHSVNIIFNMTVQLQSLEYDNYSIYSFPVNTSDISISENPLRIMEDIFDQSSISFVQDQSSDAQTDASSFKFQCYFGEREMGQKIYQEFGEITNTVMWVGDSGDINYRTYQDSANAVIDTTLTLNDIQAFEILENPIGTTRYRTRKANEVEVRYNYDFQKKTYLNVQVNNKNNNSFCDSSDAAGIKNKIVEKTKYIIDSATASFFLDNLTRKVTQDEEFVNLSLPPKFLVIELSDVLKVEHPMIVGSESLYQVIQIIQDYNTGITKLTARELIE